MARPKADGYIIFTTSDIDLVGVPGYKGGNYYKVLKESLYNVVMSTNKARYVGYGNSYGKNKITETPRIKVKL